MAEKNILVFALLICSTAAIDKTVLLNGGGCGVATRVPGGIVVSHDPIDLNIPLSNTIACLFTVQGYRPRHTIRFVFDHFSMSPSDCTIAFLKVYDSRTNDSARQLSPTICPNTNVAGLEYLTTSNWLTLQILVNNIWSTPPSVNFSASYASFTPKPCRFNNTQEMECSTVDRCIYNELKCDGVDGCGDYTDELSSPPANCNVTSTGASTSQSTASVAVTTTTLANAGLSDSVFPDYTPLIVILVLAGVCASIYIFYWLMSFPWCSNFIFSCLRSCLLYCGRKKKKYKEKLKANKATSLSKISPQELDQPTN